MMTTTEFMIKNCSMTFLTVELGDTSVVLAPRQCAGPYRPDQKSEHVLRLQRMGALVLSDAPEVKAREDTAPTRPKSRNTRSNG
jgi:hypothetical protein